MSLDYYTIKPYNEAFEFIKATLPSHLSSPCILIICGSGLGGLSNSLTATHTLPYASIPHFSPSTVEGHEGKLVFGILHGKQVVCMVGRKHMYEGDALIKTVFPVRVCKLLGVGTLIVTNAAGGLNKTYQIGDLVILCDHLSFAGLGGCNPLIGRNIPEFGPRFPPVSDAYDVGLRILAFKAAVAAGIELDSVREGVYSFVPGPSFETRSEAR